MFTVGAAKIKCCSSNRAPRSADQNLPQSSFFVWNNWQNRKRIFLRFAIGKTRQDPNIKEKISCNLSYAANNQKKLMLQTLVLLSWFLFWYTSFCSSYLLLLGRSHWPESFVGLWSNWDERFVLVWIPTKKPRIDLNWSELIWTFQHICHFHALNKLSIQETSPSHWQHWQGEQKPMMQPQHGHFVKAKALSPANSQNQKILHLQFFSDFFPKLRMAWFGIVFESFTVLLCLFKNEFGLLEVFELVSHCPYHPGQTQA